MKLVLVCGSWGSGTSVVAGLLVRIGCHAPGPFFQSNDPRTLNTYESIPFIEIVQRLVSNTTLALSAPSGNAVIEALGRFKQGFLREACRRRGVSEDGPIMLKYPLSAVIIGEIASVFDTRLIVVVRPLGQIEDTRKRRQWPAIFGEEGAKVIYPHIFNHVITHDTPAMVVNHSELLKHPRDCLEDIERFVFRDCNHGRLDDALSFIRTSSSQVGAESH